MRQRKAPGGRISPGGRLHALGRLDAEDSSRVEPGNAVLLFLEARHWECKIMRSWLALRPSDPAFFEQAGRVWGRQSAAKRKRDSGEQMPEANPERSDAGVWLHRLHPRQERRLRALARLESKDSIMRSREWKSRSQRSHWTHGSGSVSYTISEPTRPY